MSSDSLFRAEALKHQGVKLDGSVVIAQPLKVSVLVSILVVVVMVVVLFLSQASFNRKETVVGYLKPDLGLARVAPQRSGTLVELFVADGDSVRAGQKLALISSEEYLAHGSNLSGQLLLSLEQQQQTLQLRLDEYQLLYIQQHQALQDRVDNLLSQLTEIRSQQQLMQQRERLNKQRLVDIETLHREGHISATELNNQRELLLSMQQQRAELLVNYQQQQGQLIQLKSQLAALPREHEQQKAQLASELARLSQQHSELSARSEILITAPVAGRITNLVAQAGSMAQAGKSILTILPENSNLYAVLLVPTRAFGFIQPGQEARLRYDAFPYQRFGLYRGEVIQQSKAILLPTEVDMPVSLTEPVYQVNVQLDQQQIAAYGEQVPLQAGMLLSADIVLEQRSLLSWLFEPLLSLRGRL
ncbi:membrane fusion protein [Rheinheimera pacifica]|uniref:HlyD family secretion protein n=1 Tax=Rheinheimera pacifica TaxID=173990 RepID=UPI002169B7C6|nr:HlyD family secretion protein [Rheinheimera pacifica]MCS4309574.1 membrane fusion protein [Rheinheimera pacifica]